MESRLRCTALVLTTALAACAGSSSSPATDAGPILASDAGAPSTARPGASAPACATAEDCPTWQCECKSGPPVNTRHCVDRRCEDAAEACPASCAGFGSCWIGVAEGGWDGGTNTGASTCVGGSGSSGSTSGGSSGSGSSSGGSSGSSSSSGSSGQSAGPCGDHTSFTDVGRNCTGQAASVCQSSLCYGTPGSYVCTKRCASANECPAHWKCVLSQASGFTICMLGDLSSPGSPESTNASCPDVTVSDLGASCTRADDCQSGVCLSNGECSARCEEPSDCSNGWTCSTSSSSGFKFCSP